MAYGRHRNGRARWPLLGFGLGGVALTAAIIATAVGITQVAGSQACASTASAATDGIATHYVLQPGGGNCSYPSPPADGLYVALSPPEYDNAAPCGGYLEVSGPDGSVRVEVIDQCPPCASGHIDLSATAFARIAPLSAGLVSVSYQTLVDPALPGPVALRVKEGSSQYWLALLVMNTGNPVASVQVETSPGSWRALSRASFNYWIAQNGAGLGPFTVRVTDTLGHQVTVRGVALEPGVVQQTGTWMYGAGTAPPPTSAPPSTAPSSSTSPAAPPSDTAPAASPRGAGASGTPRRRAPAPATSATTRLAARAGQPTATPAGSARPSGASPGPSC